MSSALSVQIPLRLSVFSCILLDFSVELSFSHRNFASSLEGLSGWQKESGFVLESLGKINQVCDKNLSFATLPSGLGFCLRKFLIQILSSVLITYRECFPRSQRDQCSALVSERRWKKELSERLQHEVAQPSHHN